MAARIPDNIIDQILDNVDIVELIAGYVPLKRAGRNFRALCPFHHEKTPSFMVNPAKQIFHCFGCGMGGNALHFLMKYENMQFLEAIETLAKKANVEIPREKDLNYLASDNTLIYRANEFATEYYHNTLVKTEHGKMPRQYLKERCIADSTVALLKLGYAPKVWDGFLKFATSKGYNMNLLERAGLVLTAEDAGYHDRFRDRVMFPIFDIKGKVIAFGGRVIDEAASPKYMNSPETQVYSKGRHLYGMNLALQYIKDNDACIIVEGYLDFITPYQEGVRNTVASLGTSLTVEHVRLIKRYTRNVIMVYDSDRAGEAAALRGLDLLLQEELNVNIVNLPEDCDPDDFVKRFGVQVFQRLVKEAKNLFDYKLGILTSKFDSHDVAGKVKIASEMLPTIKKIRNAVLRSDYIRKLSDALSVSEEALLIEIKRVKDDYSGWDLEDTTVEFKRPTAPIAERLLLGLILEDIQKLKVAKQQVKVEDFQDDRLKRIAKELFDSKEPISPSKLINRFQDYDMSSLLADVMNCAEQLLDREKTFADCITRIRQDNLKSQLANLQEMIRLAEDSGDHAKATQLLKQYNILVRDIRGAR